MVKPGLTHHFLQEIHVQNQEYDSCFQIVPLVDMVKLLFGFCRLSLLNYTLEYGTFVITFINLFIADFQVPQGGFQCRVINIYINIQ